MQHTARKDTTASERQSRSADNITLVTFASQHGVTPALRCLVLTTHNVMPELRVLGHVQHNVSLFGRNPAFLAAPLPTGNVSFLTANFWTKAGVSGGLQAKKAKIM